MHNSIRIFASVLEAHDQLPHPAMCMRLAYRDERASTKTFPGNGIVGQG